MEDNNNPGTPRPVLLATNLFRSNNDDEIINTILPSYHMFQATISKKLVPNEESFKDDPPEYELSPIHSGGLSPVASRATGSTSSLNAAAVEDAHLDILENTAGEGDHIFTQSSADFWNNTVLANVHKLQNLSEQNNVLARSLLVELKFTQSVCQVGQPPDIIDVLKAEYRPGDYLHGYVTIVNTHNEPIPFDMVYVAFEGILKVSPQPGLNKEKDTEPIVYKFLNMLDLFASWSYANIDRLVSDCGDPHDWCEGETDPRDNTLLSIDIKRTFMPGITYKRFFSFRIPERLLDDCCDTHSLDAHCQVPPTLGAGYSLNCPKARSLLGDNFKDFSQVNSFVGYSVTARVMGRASQYGIKLKQDRYVLASEDDFSIRVIPYSVSNHFPASHNHEVNANFKELVQQIAMKIEQGQLVAEGARSEGAGALSSFIPVSTSASRTSLSLLNDKVRQLYVSPSRDEKATKKVDGRYYRHVSLYERKGLTGVIKSSGSIYVSTPQTTYQFSYVPPVHIRIPGKNYDSSIRVPIDYSFVCKKSSGNSSIPAIKDITAELVVMTISSKKHEIPLEFNHEMFFDDEIVDHMGIRKKEDLTTFEKKVINPFQSYYSVLISLMKKIGLNDPAFRVETKLFKDVKSLAFLQTKRINLSLTKMSFFEDINGELVPCSDFQLMKYDVSSSSHDGNVVIHSKKLEVDITLQDFRWKAHPDGDSQNGFDHICLVPEFQKCFMTRIYYLRLLFTHKHGVSQVLHVPISIVA